MATNPTLPPQQTAAPRKPASGCGILFLLTGAFGLAPFLTCGILCAGVRAVGSAGGAAREKKIAQVSEAEQQTIDASHAPQAGTVGFRKLTLTYQPEEGPARERQVLLWYPAPGEEE